MLLPAPANVGEAELPLTPHLELELAIDLVRIEYEREKQLAERVAELASQAPQVRIGGLVMCPVLPIVSIVTGCNYFKLQSLHFLFQTQT